MVHINAFLSSWIERHFLLEQGGEAIMISIKGLNKIFKSSSGDVKAVEDLNISIPKGEIFGVIGYSGAGKSTLIRLLNRLEEPTSGEVIIDDQDVTNLSTNKLREARQDIAMIFQHFNLLWSRTVRENIAFPLEIAKVSKQEREKRVDELIQLVGLSGSDRDEEDALSTIVSQHESGKVLHLHFVGEKTNQALISEIAKRFPVAVNILHGKITQTKKGAYGTLIVHIDGSSEAIQEAIHYIEETSVEVEVSSDVS